MAWFIIIDKAELHIVEPEKLHESSAPTVYSQSIEILSFMIRFTYLKAYEPSLTCPLSEPPLPIWYPVSNLIQVTASVPTSSTFIHTLKHNSEVPFSIAITAHQLYISHEGIARCHARRRLPGDLANDQLPVALAGRAAGNGVSFSLPWKPFRFNVEGADVIVAGSKLKHAPLVSLWFHLKPSYDDWRFLCIKWLAQSVKV